MLEPVDAAEASPASGSPEREAGEGPSSEGAAEAVELGGGVRFRRALELDGELRLDQSRGPRTHFCQHCEAENPLNTSACYHCGTPLGGPDQAHFDATKREEIRAAERARRRERRVEELELEIRRLRQELELRDAERAASHRGRILRASRWATAVIAVCLFVTASAALNLFLNIAYSDQVPWGVISQAAVSALITLAVFLHLRDKMDGL